MALSAGTAVGQYEIVSLIGAGGMGEVYRARDTRLGRDVALKILPDAFADNADRLVRFEREARLLASLNHPNIATIHGVEEAGAVKAIVLEFIDGSTLADLVAFDRLPVSDALAIATQVAEALESAHASGVIHRDLKPANIKVHDGRVKVLDFGLAKVLDVAQVQPPFAQASTVTTPAATRYGVVLGTPAYMAPEQTRGEPVDEQADIWAFGCVLFELLTGRPPFEGRSVSDIIAAILRGAPDWRLLPAHLHPRIRLLLERCLEKDKANRYHTIADARVDLQRAISDPLGFAPPVSQRHGAAVAWYWVAALVAVGALVVGAAVWAIRAPRDLSVRRFSEVLPTAAAFTNVGHPLVAIAPDSSSIAYVANARVFLRVLDRADAVAIAGTEGSPTTPFFSPDGQFIGYFDFRAGELRRVPAGGGTPVTLAKVNNVFGARWEADETILYGADSGIWRVSAQGGTPEQLVRIDDGERVHAPQLLPGADAILFTRRPGTGSSRWQQAEIVVQSLRTGERKVIRRGRDGRYLPTGHIVYAADGTLFASAFDLSRLEPLGAPIPVVQGLRFGVAFPGMTGTANYDVSQDGVLVHVHGTQVLPARRQLVAVDRSGKAEPLVPEMRNYWRPRISPDGSRIAVEVEEESGERLWIVSVDEGTAAPFSTDDGNYVFYAWTPDGKSLVYRSDRADQYGIYQQRVDGSDAPHLLHAASEDLMPGDVSRDGVLVFASGEQTGRRSILTLRLGESTPVPYLATPVLEHMPTFSPDGQWIAYASSESGRSEIYIRSYPPTEAPARRISQNGGTAPVWSPQGSELFYRSDSGALVAVPLRVAAGLTPGREQVLFPVSGRFRTSGNAPAYDVEPGGRRFIMVTEPANPTPVRAQINIVYNWFEELKRLSPR